MTNKRKHTTVSIPICLAEQIEKIMGKYGCTSVSDYAKYILRKDLEEKNGKS